MKFPCGVADFHRIRCDGLVYVGRTAHMRDLETLGDEEALENPYRCAPRHGDAR